MRAASAPSAELIITAEQYRSALADTDFTFELRAFAHSADGAHYADSTLVSLSVPSLEVEGNTASARVAETLRVTWRNPYRQHRARTHAMRHTDVRAHC